MSKSNVIYYGDNLHVLRRLPTDHVDLIYLDPPFNSNRNYNVLFKESTGTESEAQIQAFEDTWHWGKHGSSLTDDTFNEVASKGDDVAQMLQAFVNALGRNDVTAYLTMMAARLIELRRVLKSSGSIYIHCDPTASHYLKVLMDAVFGPVNFKNEIVWPRTNAHHDARRFGRIHDVLLFYSKSNNFTWNPEYVPYSDEQIKKHYTHIEESTGRHFRLSDLSAAKPGGDVEYGWKGVKPPVGRYWAYSRANMEKFDAQNRIYYTKNNRPFLKQYLDDMPGNLVQDIWADVPFIHGSSKELLGYKTQKPEALLRRIINASSNPSDVVLDPFCGCGTAVAAAHSLGRKWIGIDITYLAVDLIKNRLLTRFPGDFPKGIEVDGEPADEAAALALAQRDKYQFQFWTVAKLGGTSRGGENHKGADRGIDGVLAFPDLSSTKSGKNGMEWRQVIVSVKGGNTGPSHVRDLIGTVENERAAIGVLVTAHQPTNAMAEAAASAGIFRSNYDKKSYPKIQIITAGDIVRGDGIKMPPRAGITQYAPAPRSKRGTQGEMEM